MVAEPKKTRGKPSESGKRAASFVLPRDLLLKIRMESARRGIWPSEFATECFEQFFDRHGKEAS